MKIGFPKGEAPFGRGCRVTPYGVGRCPKGRGYGTFVQRPLA